MGGGGHGLSGRVRWEWKSFLTSSLTIQDKSGKYRLSLTKKVSKRLHWSRMLLLEQNNTLPMSYGSYWIVVEIAGIAKLLYRELNSWMQPYSLWLQPICVKHQDWSSYPVHLNAVRGGSGGGGRISVFRGRKEGTSGNSRKKISFGLTTKAPPPPSLPPRP